MEARPSAVATVNTAAAAKVERRVFATTGTSAMNAGRSRRKAAAAPSLAMRHAWLDLQEEIPVDVVEHEDVETSGAKTSAAPVATAVPSVSARRPRASTATRNVVLRLTIPVGVPWTRASVPPSSARQAATREPAQR